MFTRDPLRRIDLAFGLFDRILRRLQAAVEACRDELTQNEEAVEALQTRQQDLVGARERARIAISNLRSLMSQRIATEKK